MGRLKGKVAIITGAANGMGEMHVRKYVEEGAKVVITDIDEAKIEALSKELGENTIAMKLDVSKEDEWIKVIEKTEEVFGPVTILVNNAGIIIAKPIEELTAADFELTYRINELGVFLGMQKAAESMKKAGVGSIINVSSVDGIVSAPLAVSYSSSKFAVTGMTKAAAIELGKHNIRVNSVHPGIIKTEMAIKPEVAKTNEKLILDTPLRRMGELEEVSNLMVYIGSDESSYQTAAEFVIDGGMIADL